MELLGYFLCASKTFENLGNFSEPTTPFCMPNSTYFKSLSAPDIANPLKLTFSAKFLRGLITFAQVVLAIFSTLLFSIPLSKCLLKSVYFSVGFFFVVLKTSLCTLDSSSFTCLSSLSILYQTVPYAFI